MFFTEREQECENFVCVCVANAFYFCKPQKPPETTKLEKKAIAKSELKLMLETKSRNCSVRKMKQPPCNSCLSTPTVPFPPFLSLYFLL